MFSYLKNNQFERKQAGCFYLIPHAVQVAKGLQWMETEYIRYESTGPACTQTDDSQSRISSSAHGETSPKRFTAADPGSLRSRR